MPHSLWCQRWHEIQNTIHHLGDVATEDDPKLQGLLAQEDDLLQSILTTPPHSLRGAARILETLESELAPSPIFADRRELAALRSVREFLFSRSQ